MSLIDTLENVKMVTDSLIPAEDQQEVNRIWEEFSKQFAKLTDVWNMFIKLDQENTDDPYNFMRPNYVSSATCKPIFWTYKYDILHAEKLIGRSLNAVERKIIEYFNAKYNTAYEVASVLRDSLFTPENRFTGQTPELNILLDSLIKLNGGCSFTDKGDQDFKAQVGHLIQYSQLKINGTSVSIAYAWELPSYSTTVGYINQRHLMDYLDAISYCFYGNTSTPVIHHDDERQIEYHAFAYAYEPRSVLLKNIRFVKNNRQLVFRFLKGEDAQRFYDFLVEQKAAA